MLELLESKTRRRAYLEAIATRGLVLSGLSCHSNPLHPDPAVAKEADEVLRRSIRLASLLGVPVVNTFSGLPAGAPGDTRPNWVTCRLIGYDYVVSIEHEDALMSSHEELAKAVAALKEAVIVDQPGTMYWA
jgi:sugar phosphate isomerase/epimerase